MDGLRIALLACKVELMPDDSIYRMWRWRISLLCRSGTVSGVKK